MMSEQPTKGEKMNKPKFSAHRIMHLGKPAVELVVNHVNNEMRPLLETLGYVPTVDMINRRSIICTCPAEVDAARNPLVPYFDATGTYIK